MFVGVDKALFGSIVPDWGEDLLQTRKLTAVTGIDRCQSAAFRRLIAPSVQLYYLAGGAAGRGGNEGKWGVGGVFCWG